MIWTSAGSPGDGAQQPLAPGHGFVARSPRAASRAASASRRAASRSGSPSCGRRRSSSGQRGRRGGDDPAGRRVGQRLQHEERLVDLLVVVAVVVARRPSRASSPRVSASACSGSTASGQRLVRDGNQVSTNGTRSPGRGRTRRRSSCSRRATSTGVRKQSASGPAIATRASSTRRTHGTIRRSRSGSRARSASAPPVEALDDPHDVGRAPARRHEVDRPHRCPRRSRRPTRGSACRAGSGGSSADRRAGRQEPAPVLGPAQERREAGARVEPREAAPVDRARRG